MKSGISNTAQEHHEKSEAEKTADGWIDRSKTPETYTGVYMGFQTRKSTVPQKATCQGLEVEVLRIDKYEGKHGMALIKFAGYGRDYISLDEIVFCNKGN